MLWHTSINCGKAVLALGLLPGSEPPTAMLSRMPKGWSKGAVQLPGEPEVCHPSELLQWLLTVAYCTPSTDL